MRCERSKNDGAFLFLKAGYCLSAYSLVFILFLMGTQAFARGTQASSVLSYTFAIIV
jgi:hypothetical protein